MYRYIICWGLVFSASISFSQETLLLQYANSITKEELKEHVYHLASDTYEGRYTGSEGQRMAAEYIQKEFHDDGLTPPYRSVSNPFFQEFSLGKCYWHDQYLASNGIIFYNEKDYVFLGDPENLTGDFPVVFAGFGIDDPLYSDYTDIDVNGKVVVAFSGEPRGQDGLYLLSGRKEASRKSNYYSKARTAAARGAMALVIIAQEEKDFRQYVKRSKDSRGKADISYPDTTRKESVPTVFASLKTAAAILNTVPRSLEAALRNMEAEQTTKSGIYTGSMTIKATDECYKMNTENVAAMVLGTDLRDEAVVVVAHYDHLGRKDGKVYYGADDNASGTAAVMEVAEAFVRAAQDGFQPRRSVVFLAVTAEELGLYGSRYYTEHPIIPLESTFACINIDMIGRASSKWTDEPDYVAGYAYLSEDIMQVSRQYNGLMAPALDDRMEFRAKPRGGSDHYYFARNGIPSLFYFTGIHKDYHSPADTPDKILYDRMEKITRAIFGAAWELANREEELMIEDGVMQD